MTQKLLDRLNFTCSTTYKKTLFDYLEKQEAANGRPVNYMLMFLHIFWMLAKACTSANVHRDQAAVCGGFAAAHDVCTSLAHWHVGSVLPRDEATLDPDARERHRNAFNPHKFMQHGDDLEICSMISSIEGRVVVVIKEMFISWFMLRTVPKVTVNADMFIYDPKKFDKLSFDLKMSGHTNHDSLYDKLHYYDAQTKLGDSDIGCELRAFLNHQQSVGNRSKLEVRVVVAPPSSSRPFAYGNNTVIRFIAKDRPAQLKASTEGLYRMLSASQRKAQYDRMWNGCRDKFVNHEFFNQRRWTRREFVKFSRLRSTYKLLSNRKLLLDMQEHWLSKAYVSPAAVTLAVIEDADGKLQIDSVPLNHRVEDALSTGLFDANVGWAAEAQNFHFLTCGRCDAHGLMGRLMKGVDECIQKYTRRGYMHVYTT